MMAHHLDRRFHAALATIGPAPEKLPLPAARSRAIVHPIRAVAVFAAQDISSPPGTAA
jgi:hypothetical protein